MQKDEAIRPRLAGMEPDTGIVAALERARDIRECAAIVDHFFGQVEAYMTTTALGTQSLRATAPRDSELAKEAEALALVTGEFVQWLRWHRGALQRCMYRESDGDQVH